MHSFMVESLRVTGADKEDAYVEFADGLNIIRGRSNTGKTWILKCLYYLFSSDTRPFSPSTGYTDIVGTFLTKSFGRMTISRKLDDTTAVVLAESNEIEDGEYATNYKKKKQGTRYLNDLWLRIIGLDATIEVPKNENYARDRISWTNIAGAFITDESEIAKEGSIILKEPTYATSLISSLIYLLSGDFKEGVKEIPKKEILEAQSEGRSSFIREQQKRLKQQRSDLILQLEELASIDVEKAMEELTSRIQEIQARANELVEESRSLSRQIAVQQQEEASCKVLIDRYEKLASQYKADLARLDFVSKGETAVRELPQIGTCPFCGGPMHPDSDPLYAEAIEGEARRIASELAVIVATEVGVRDDLSIIQAELADLMQRKSEVAKKLEVSSREIRDYSSDIQKYREYSSLSGRIEFVETQLLDLGEQLANPSSESEKTEKYRAKKEFKKIVGSDFDESLNRILKDCNYRTGGYASWDFTKFDVCIDGIPKSEDQGQGYCSFLNSVVSMMFYEYFNREGVFIKPGILMIDTPLLGFDENELGFDGQTIKVGLYQYFRDHQGDGQMIIVDNMGVMPNIDFESHGVNVITYHKDEEKGHVYGFMPSLRRDLPKEEQ
ncbi:hypothetical protein [Curtanaerobium respiraculi]|uniref:hypothetical protein n=1 Tax=Curtanaerobium respiraculi TaxID=2949669 RepID=UPI0024B3C35F|nr:hypothetical protein [Curtanaerobium respiraculi]